MTDRDEVRRLAEAHADYYNDHSNTSMAEFAEKYWSPDIEMYFGGQGTPHGIDGLVRGHDTEKGFSWADTKMDVKKVVVGDDAFVLQMEIVQWRSHEADAVAVGIDGVEGVDSTDYQAIAIPLTIIYHVSDGKVVRSDSYMLVGVAGRAATGASAP